MSIFDSSCQLYLQSNPEWEGDGGGWREREGRLTEGAQFGFFFFSERWSLFELIEVIFCLSQNNLSQP